jgi:hypothetical protein
MHLGTRGSGPAAPAAEVWIFPVPLGAALAVCLGFPSSLCEIPFFKNVFQFCYTRITPQRDHAGKEAALKKQKP